MRVLINSVETSGLEPPTPCLQIRPTRTTANSDGQLRLLSSTIRTLANEYERLRALPFCYHSALANRQALSAKYLDVDLKCAIYGDCPDVTREQDQAAFHGCRSDQRVVHRPARDSQIRESW